MDKKDLTFVKLEESDKEKKQAREREREREREKRTPQDSNDAGQVDQEVGNAGQKAEKTDKYSQDVSQEVGVAQAGDDVVAEETMTLIRQKILQL